MTSYGRKYRTSTLCASGSERFFPYLNNFPSEPCKRLGRACQHIGAKYSCAKIEMSSGTFKVHDDSDGPRSIAVYPRKTGDGPVQAIVVTQEFLLPYFDRPLQDAAAKLVCVVPAL
eukprot:2406017-Rhodomonas_salina.1